MSKKIKWSSMEPFGAKVELDLSKDINNATIDELCSLFDEHHLLYFPEQQLSAEAQSRVCGWFGPLTGKSPSEFDNTSDIDGLLGAAELAFHSDLSCAPEPLLGLSLFGLEIEEGAAPTWFADAMGPVNDLEGNLRIKLEALHVMNLWPTKLDERQRSASAPVDWPGTAHPVLKAHPRTGKPVIYVNASHSDRIVELPDDVGEVFINLLFTKLYQPSNIYEHSWKTGDFIIWDNIALQHSRPASQHKRVRRLRRVELGSAGYVEQMPPQLLARYRAPDSLGGMA